MSSADVCDTGYYDEDGTCTPCTQGTYKNTVGPEACTACSATGTTTSVTGAIDQSQCGKLYQIKNCYIK